MHFQSNSATRVGLTLGLLVIIALGLSGVPPSSVRAQSTQVKGVPPFDFSDAFYLQNGINPANILNRVDGTCPSNDMPSCSVVDNSNTNPIRRNIRILSTTGGFDAAGNPLYYTIDGMVNPNTFTSDAAGLKAMKIANFFSAYIFPKASGDPLSPALSNRRQDNVFDTRNGYFDANPLGLWTAVFVSYTATGLDPNNAVCKDALDTLRAENGTDLDGTPQIHKAIEVDNLEKKGCAEENTRALDGTQGFPWII
jgi:hypothetical protein